MAIETVAEVLEYTGDGATVIFPITFDYLEDEYVLVKHFDSSTNILSTLVLTDDYTISNGEVQTVLTYPIGDKIYLTLSVIFTQEVDLLENGQISSDILDLVHDKLTLMAQELNIKKNGTLYVELPESTNDLTIPPTALRADRILCFDSNGDVTVKTFTDLDAVSITPYGESLIDDADAAEARTTLDVYSEAEVDADIATLESDLGGTGRTTETIKDNADDIATNSDDLGIIELGFNAITLTNWDSSATVPSVAAGSKIEANGTVYSFTTSQAISTTGASSGTVYIVFDDATSEFKFTSTAPTWSATLNGWYISGKRFIERFLTWDGSSSFTSKKEYRENSQSGNDVIVSTSGDIETGGEVLASDHLFESSLVQSSRTLTGGSTYLIPKGTHFISYEFNSAKGGSPAAYNILQAYVGGGWVTIYVFAHRVAFTFVSNGSDFRIHNSDTSSHTLYWLSR